MIHGFYYFLLLLFWNKQIYNKWPMPYFRTWTQTHRHGDKYYWLIMLIHCGFYQEPGYTKIFWSLLVGFLEIPSLTAWTDSW